MEKNREAELKLPEEIIHRIQSFLDGKEAARTTFLSRSWFQAWLTRPNLDFDQEHYSSPSRSDGGFWRLVKTTVERYEKHNLKIDSFKPWFNLKEDYFVNDLIIKSLKLGATCLDFKIHWLSGCFKFPSQVFGFENLTRLSVRGCKIGAVKEEDKERLLKKRSGLKSITLELVISPDNSVIWDVVKSCPLIEDFSLTFMHDGWGVPESFIRKQCLSHAFHNLKSLYLSKARFDPSFFHGLWFKFPCLVDLTLLDCCRGCTLHSSAYYFNWRSNIHITAERAPSASWFCQLALLLKKLRSSDSEVVLGLYMWAKRPLMMCTMEFKGVHNKPEVFHVTINGPYCVVVPDFYSSLFKICRPSCIEPYTIPRFKQDQCVDDEIVLKCLDRRGKVNNLVWKRYIQRACLDSCIKYQKMGVCDLRKVEVDFYDESISRRCTQLVDTTSTTSIIRNAPDDEQIFFNLKWGP